MILVLLVGIAILAMLVFAIGMTYFDIKESRQAQSDTLNSKKDSG